MKSDKRVVIGIWATVLVVVLLTLTIDFASSSTNGNLEVPHNGEDWPMFHATPDHRGYTTSWAPESNNVAWTLQYTDGSETKKYVFESVIVEGDRVYANGKDRYPIPRIPEDNPSATVAVNLRNGSIIWKYDYNPMYGFTPIIPVAHDGRIWVGDGNYIRVLSAFNGTLLTTVPGYYGATGYEYGFSVTPDAIYLDPNSAPCRIKAYNTSTLLPLWSSEMDSCSYGAPSVSGDYLTAISQKGTLYRLRIDNGSVVWSVPTGVRSSTTTAISQGKVVVAFDDGSVRAYDIESGLALWEYHTGTHIGSSPAISDSIVYVGSGDGGLYAIDFDTGTLRWRFLTDGAIYSSPAVAPNAVVFGSLNHRVYALDPETGDLKWSYETGGEVRGSPAIAKGHVIIGSSDGRLYAFGPDSPTDLKLVWLAVCLVIAGTVSTILIAMASQRRRIVYLTGGDNGGQILRKTKGKKRL